MLEKQVSFKGDKGGLDTRRGVVKDRYLGIKSVTIDIPSNHGTTTGVVYVNVDFYIIETQDGLCHVECSRILSVD